MRFPASVLIDLFHLVTVVIINIQKFLRSDRQKACQSISNSAKTFLVQKDELEIKND